MANQTLPAVELASTNRMRSLDGLRGLAAVIVLLNHVMLLDPSFAETYLGNGGIPGTGSTLWWLTATPLKFFTAGGEAVTIFFVLSGVVLTVPVLAKRDFNWWSYFPRRVVRLYLPALASIVLAAVWILSFARAAGVDYGYWVNVFGPSHPTLKMFTTTADLLYGDAIVNNPLWSLKWEVLFSLGLPIFVGLAVILRARPWVWILGAAVVAGAGDYFQQSAWQYLPAFMIGALLAVSLDRLKGLVERVTRRTGWLVGTVATIVAICLLVAYWLFRSSADHDPVIAGITIALSTLGATAIVALAAFWGPAVRVLSSRIFQFLGKISFSLYLVHVPVAFAAIYFFGPAKWEWAALTTIPISFVLAVLFQRFVESPSHTLSKRVGSWISSKGQPGKDLVV